MKPVYVTRVLIRGYHGKGACSRLIKILPYRKYSHVSLVFYFSNGSAIEYQSLQPKGVQNNLPTTGASFAAKEPRLTFSQKQSAYAKAREITGGYDFRAIFGFVFKWMKESKNRWICSEYVAEIMEFVGNKLSGLEPFQETPTSVMMSNTAGELVT